MSQKQKLIHKICAQAQVSIDEIETLMRCLGFKVRQTGSHVVFTKPGSPGITIPSRPQVKPIYLKQLCILLHAEK